MLRCAQEAAEFVEQIYMTHRLSSRDVLAVNQEQISE